MTKHVGIFKTHEGLKLAEDVINQNLHKSE